MSAGPFVVAGRLVLEERVVPGRIVIRDERIVEVEPDGVDEDGPFVAPGFVDVHVHGWGGHDAMGERSDLDGMAQVLLRHGVTSFLPTAVSAPIATLVRFAEQVRGWMPDAPPDGAQPLGFNLEGPFLAPARRGAHELAHLRTPADVDRAQLEPLLEGLRLTTIAPELPGALDLIAWLRDRGVATSMGHSAADLETTRAGYGAGGTTTTHLFNAMTGVDHRAPGVAVAALTDDDAFVELIADDHHVHRGLWPLITRLKPVDRLLLVSDALAVAGMGEGRRIVRGREVDVVGERCTVAGTGTLAGSVIALDRALANLVGSGVPLPAAVAAASSNPRALLGISDRGRIAAGQRADLVELDEALGVRRVMRGGRWFEAGTSRSTGSRAT